MKQAVWLFVNGFFVGYMAACLINGNPINFTLAVVCIVVNIIAALINGSFVAYRESAGAND